MEFIVAINLKQYELPDKVSLSKITIRLFSLIFQNNKYFKYLIKY